MFDYINTSPPKQKIFMTQSSTNIQKTSILTQTNTPINVLYKDSHIIVVDKPPKLLTVPGRGPEKQDCLIHRLLADYPDTRIIHRLDMATSGIVVLALSHQAQSQISQLFAKRQVTKTYHAIVSGRLNVTEDCIDKPLICDWEHRPKQKVDYEYGKSAQTHYRVSHYYEESHTSRVILSPLTGRSHQLRVHMSSIGHPILGDYFYAPNNIYQSSKRLLLHAQAIEFIHPLENRVIAITCPTPF